MLGYAWIRAYGVEDRRYFRKLTQPGMTLFTPYCLPDAPAQPLVHELYAAKTLLAAIHEIKMRIAFLHTADVHVATFDQIFDSLDCNVQLDHHVDASLLERARQDGVEAVRADVQTRLKELSFADAVLCTCSTLGPLADDAAKSSKTIIRIDRPLMQLACADGEKILVALCLDSTRDATLDLLSDCAQNAGQNISPIVVICRNAWAFFQAGDIEAYAASIAASIRSKVAQEPDVRSIVLAQASMRVAETRLIDTGIPVRSSPVIAAKRCLEVAQLYARKPGRA